MKMMNFAIPDDPMVRRAVANCLLNEGGDRCQTEPPLGVTGQGEIIGVTDTVAGTDADVAEALAGYDVLPAHPFSITEAGELVTATGGPIGTEGYMFVTRALDASLDTIEDPPVSFEEFARTMLNGVAAANGLTPDELTEETPPNPFAGAAPAETPVVPPPAATVATPAVELDAAGLPWDIRIHASSKKKIRGDFWRKKRGIDPALVVKVEAELRAALAAPAPAPAATPAAGGSVPPPTATAVQITTLEQLTAKLLGAKVPSAKIHEELAKYNIASLVILGSAKPELIPTVAMNLLGTMLV